MLVSSREAAFSFLIDVKEVSQTKTEKEMTQGRDCYTIEEFVEAYGGKAIWVEVVQVIDEPKPNMDVEDESFPAPVYYEIVQPMCRVCSNRGRPSGIVRYQKEVNRMDKRMLLELLEGLPDNAVIIVEIPRFDMPEKLDDKRVFSWALGSVAFEEGQIKLRTPGTEEDFQ